MSNNNCEKQSANSGSNSPSCDGARQHGADSWEEATRTRPSNVPSSTGQQVSLALHESQDGQGVAGRPPRIPPSNSRRPGAEAVRGPDYRTEDEEGTVVIGESIESSEIVTAHLVDVETEEELRVQVASLQEELHRLQQAGASAMGASTSGDNTTEDDALKKAHDLRKRVDLHAQLLQEANAGMCATRPSKTRTIYVWEFLDDFGAWKSFEPTHQSIIEQHYRDFTLKRTLSSNVEIESPVWEYPYQVDVARFVLTNVSLPNVRQRNVRRRLKERRGATRK